MGFLLSRDVEIMLVWKFYFINFPKMPDMKQELVLGGIVDTHKELGKKINCTAQDAVIVAKVLMGEIFR
jgi:hypothetical protein